MYIGPWHELRLANAFTRPSDQRVKDLEQYYTQWREMCDTVGEEKATNALIWGPLFSGMKNGKYSHNNNDNDLEHSSDIISNSHHRPGTGPTENLQRLQLQLEDFETTRRNLRGKMSKPRYKKPVKKSIRDVEKMKRIYLNTMTAGQKISDRYPRSENSFGSSVRRSRSQPSTPASAGRIVVADPRRYKTADDLAKELASNASHDIGINFDRAKEVHLPSMAYKSVEHQLAGGIGASAGTASISAVPEGYGSGRGSPWKHQIDIGSTSVVQQDFALNGPKPSPLRKPGISARAGGRSRGKSRSPKKKIMGHGLFQKMASEDTEAEDIVHDIPGAAILPATPGSPSSPGFEDEVDDLLRWTEGLKASPDESWSLE